MPGGVSFTWLTKADSTHPNTLKLHQWYFVKWPSLLLDWFCLRLFAGSGPACNARLPSFSGWSRDTSPSSSSLDLNPHTKHVSSRNSAACCLDLLHQPVLPTPCHLWIRPQTFFGSLNLKPVSPTCLWCILHFGTNIRVWANRNGPKVWWSSTRMSYATMTWEIKHKLTTNWNKKNTLSFSEFPQFAEVLFFFFGVFMYRDVISCKTQQNMQPCC